LQGSARHWEATRRTVGPRPTGVKALALAWYPRFLRGSERRTGKPVRRSGFRCRPGEPFKGLAVLARTGPTVPSWNTDQGVQRACERVGGKLKRTVKAKVVTRTTKVGRCLRPALPPPVTQVTGRWSMPAETRKTANYACAGRSQGKPWWRFGAVLTCESLAGHGYRGERLIERSSSWFLPKFPAG